MKWTPIDRVFDGIGELRNRGPAGFARAVTEYGLLRSPLSNVVLRDLYWKVAPRYYRWRWSHPKGYIAPLDPFKIIWVSPNKIKRFSRRQYPQDANATQLLGSVKGGEWDLQGDIPTRQGYNGTPAYLYHADSFEDTIIHQSIKQRFVNETPWAETPIVSEAKSLLDSGQRYWRGCESEAAIHRRCQEIENLYSHISNEGIPDPV